VQIEKSTSGKICFSSLSPLLQVDEIFINSIEEAGLYDKTDGSATICVSSPSVAPLFPLSFCVFLFSPPLQVDEIFINSIKEAGLYDKIWQASAVPFLAVRGRARDRRTHSTSSPCRPSPARTA